jgi:hypothetical protein
VTKKVNCGLSLALAITCALIHFCCCSWSNFVHFCYSSWSHSIVPHGRT